MSQQIFPSNMALIQQKAKMKSAAKGRDLLKRKADALKAQFRKILKDLIEKKQKLGSCYSDALIYLAKANFSSSGGELSRTIEENVKSNSEVKLSLKKKNIAGVVCPEFSLRNFDSERSEGSKTTVDILGITGGGHTLNIAKKQFNEYLKLIIEIATLQTNYKSMDETLKITNRRVNALEYIVVPRINGVIQYIDTELKEREKEDKFRIKKVLQNKKKHKENAIKAMLKSGEGEGEKEDKHEDENNLIYGEGNEDDEGDVF